MSNVQMSKRGGVWLRETNWTLSFPYVLLDTLINVFLPEEGHGIVTLNWPLTPQDNKADTRRAAVRAAITSQ